MKFVLGLSLYVTVWDNWPDSSAELQFLAVTIFCLSAAIPLLTGAFRSTALSPVELALYLCVIGSVIMATVYDADYGIQYSMIFLLVLISVSIIARSISLPSLLAVMVWSAFAAVVSVIIFDAENYLVALSVHTTEWGMFRFGPLGTHPNLAGVVYSGCAVVLAYGGITHRIKAVKILFLAASLLSLTYVMAASARASILAMLVTLVLILYRSIRFRHLGILAISISGIVVVPLLMGGSVLGLVDYIAQILEVESDTRGLGSGSSGRAELWAAGWELIVSDPLRFYFGGGLRTAGENDIGFQLESSYLNLLFEVGLFLTALLMAQLIRVAWVGVTRFRIQGSDVRYPLAPALILIVFLMLQSIFNRYLIGIGNFASLSFLVLIVNLDIFLRKEFVRTSNIITRN